MRRTTAAAERALVRAHVEAALAEDRAQADLTSAVGLPPGARGEAVLVAGAEGVLAGMEPAALGFKMRSPRLVVRALLKDGARLRRGTAVLRVRGPAALILSAERTSLNYLMRLSGVASLASRYVERLKGTGVRLLDTRKTTPVFRLFEKRAVRSGGGLNHRMGLHDAVLIKENHVRMAGGLAAAVARAREGLRRAGREEALLEAEAQSLAEVREARDLPLGRILLDNFSPAQVRRALTILRARRAPRPMQVEVSGGVQLGNIRRYALPGVHFISVGALTHSAPALPFSLDWIA